MNPSKTDTQNGNYPNNAEETNSSATWRQRLDESHQRSARWFHQEGRRGPPASVFPMRHSTRGSAANCLSAEQERKQSMMLVDKALLVISGGAKDEVEYDDSLSKSCLSPPSPKQ